MECRSTATPCDSMWRDSSSDPCAITSHSQSIPLGVLTAVREMLLGLIKTGKSHRSGRGTVNGTPRHGIQHHVLSGNRCLRWDSGIVLSIDGVDDTSSASCHLHTKSRTRMGKTLSRTWLLCGRPQRNRQSP